MFLGGKKRSYYHDDMWNIKYLPKFRWTHLTEKVGMYCVLCTVYCTYVLLCVVCTVRMYCALYVLCIVCTVFTVYIQNSVLGNKICLNWDICNEKVPVEHVNNVIKVNYTVNFC